jgi:hypothetical protein
MRTNPTRATRVNRRSNSGDHLVTERANQLHLTADRQIAELLGVISTLDEDTSRLPCPGREKLGDGTVAACARHAADNYERIAAFVISGDRMSDEPFENGGHRKPRFARSRGHGPQAHDDHGSERAFHDGPYTAGSTDLALVARQLSTTRDTLRQIAALTDSQLDAVPPEGAFRFCDGQRTLDHVLANLLKHQARQLDALKAAI